MSAEVIQRESQSRPGEAGNDSSGPASVLAATPESSSTPTTGDIISDVLSKKELGILPNSSPALPQNAPCDIDAPPHLLTNGSYENAGNGSNTHNEKLANGHVDELHADTILPDVDKSSSTTTPDVPVEPTADTKSHATYAKLSPKSSPAQPQEEADSASGEVDSADETDESYASDLESAALDSASRDVIRSYCRDRADLAWRWSWLQLQTAELQYQLKRSGEAYDRLRAARVPPQPLIDPADGDYHALRTSGIAPAKKKRKFLKHTKMPTVTKAALLEAALSHPLFNMRVETEKESPPKPLPKKTRRDSRSHESVSEDEFVDIEDDYEEEYEYDDEEIDTHSMMSRRNQYSTPIKGSSSSVPGSAPRPRGRPPGSHKKVQSSETAEYTPISKKGSGLRSSSSASIGQPSGRGKSVDAENQTVTGNIPLEKSSSGGLDLLSPKSNRQRREKAMAALLVEAEFEDAIVIPASLINNHLLHTPLLPPVGSTKEIFTPKWKQKNPQQQGGSEQPEQDKVKPAGERTDSVRIINNGLNAEGEVVEFDDSEEGIRKQLALIEARRSADAPPSSEEDTGDEAYTKRHDPKEKYEQSRYLTPPLPVQKKRDRSRSLTDSSGRAIPDNMLVTSDPAGASRKLDFSDASREPKKRGRKPLPKNLLKQKLSSMPTGSAPTRASGWRKWVRGTDFLDASWEIKEPVSTAISPPPAMEVPIQPASFVAPVATTPVAPESASGRLVIRLRRAPPGPGASLTSSQPASKLSFSQQSESSMWSERSELMTSSYSIHPNEDSLPSLGLPLPASLPLAGGELSMSTMSMAMPPSATELHTPSSPPAVNLLSSVDQTAQSPPLILEDASAADVSAFFDESSSQHHAQTTAPSSTTPTTVATSSEITKESVSTTPSAT